MVYFVEDVEDWFEYSKLNVFCHTSASFLSNINVLHTINRWIYLTSVSMIFIYEYIRKSVYWF